MNGTPSHKISVKRQALNTRHVNNLIIYNDWFEIVVFPRNWVFYKKKLITAGCCTLCTNAINFPFDFHFNWINLLDKSVYSVRFSGWYVVDCGRGERHSQNSCVFVHLKMRTPITLRRTRLLRICIVAAIVVPILYLTLTWSDEKGKSIHSQLFASRTPREAPKLISGELNELFKFFFFWCVSRLLQRLTIKRIKWD